nr:MAG TPA_asm: hypothetical protein [Caudoviricetes sp.]
MLVKVTHGYISLSGQMIGRGDVVEMDKALAARFLKSGQVVQMEQAEVKPAALPETKAEDAVVTKPARRKK